MAIDETKSDGETITAAEYNTIAQTVNDVNENGLENPLVVSDSSNNPMTIQNANSSFTRLNIDNTGSGDVQINFQFSGSTEWSIGCDDSDGDKFKIARGSTLTSNTAVTIDSSNDVGIGTTSPDSRFHVSAGSTNLVASFESTDSQANIELFDNSTSNKQILRREGDTLELCPGGGDVHIHNGFINFGSGIDVTISSGAITASGSYMVIDTEASASTDDLDTINGGTEGDFLMIRTNANTRDVTVNHGTGNIYLNGGGSFALDRIYHTIAFRYENNRWLEIFRSETNV